MEAYKLHPIAQVAWSRGLFALRAILFCVSLLSATVVGASTKTSSDFAASPSATSESAAPLVMLLMSHDHQLYIKAYNDYSDLDGDGAIDTTYNDSFDYAGYFDSKYCYGYDTDRFQPRKLAVGTNEHSCPDTGSGSADAPWSGNFLNWATMSRMDMVRRVLYGGKRYTDPAAPAGGPVILERALLPQDLHSFAKVFTGSELANFTPYSYSSGSLESVTLCNITPGPNPEANGTFLTQNMDTTTYPPKIRIAKGAWQDWSASPGTQCTWGGNSRRPTQGPDELETLIARVEACVSTLDGATSEQCRAYSNGNIKPIGLLQEFGESKGMRFGLLTGSYSGARRGGLLRKNIGYLVDNEAAAAKQDEIDLNSGEFKNQGVDTATSALYPGIINTLNSLRISRYDYDKRFRNYNDCSSSGISTATFNSDGQDTSAVACRDWGNPIAELYAEALRYFSDFSSAGGPFSQFDVDDSAHINNLKPVPWTDPQPATEHCAQCAIVVLSTGLGNFDGMAATASTSSGAENQLPSDITAFTYADLTAKMQQIGTVEDINGSYFIGHTGVEADNNAAKGSCTAKTLTPANFMDARGLCPEMPNMEGSYHIAGLAYHAKNQDMRPDRDGKQSVGTYAVQLAEMLPTFEVDVNGNKVRFVPYCRAYGSGNSDRQCSLVNIEVKDDLQGPTGKLHISWEDSSFGSDYDLDGKQELAFCIGAACDDPSTAEDESVYSYQIQLTTDIVWYQRPPSEDNADMHFGYIVSGTREDGAYLEVIGDNKTEPTSVDQAPDPASRAFTPGVSGARFLENPLWYAAKYGSFNDIDGDGTPLHNGDPANKVEWDIKDVNGVVVPGGDGIPDNFYYVKNPGRLGTRLRTIFESLTSAVQSRTSAAVISTTGRGVGALYQAIYYPSFELTNTLLDPPPSISWVGTLNALFLDDRGRIREDNGVKHKLESSSIDYPISIYFDADRQKTLVQRYDDSNVAIGDPYPLRELAPLWSAADMLANVADVVAQRPYEDDAATGRHILTWIDYDTDRKVDAFVANSEVVPFHQSSFPHPTTFVSGFPTYTSIESANYRWLGLAKNDYELGKQYVNYIRGVEGDFTINSTTVPTRSRTIDFDGDLTDEIWRLGDIIHSSPNVVAAPNDSEYTSASYLNFQLQYKKRRQVVYIGANDGMIHAFNGGFFDSATQSFIGGGDIDNDSDTPDLANHAIGAELWAYVPGNLLPHLRWLTEPDYPHVYYADGAIQVFDAQIFTPDIDHPDGWGTILVAGMRLGGGAMTIEVEKDALHDGLRDVGGPYNVTTTSAYVILDVTNPEKPPQVIAEISPGDQSFTLSSPVVVRSSASGTDDWLLVFGNGPDNLSTVTTNSDSTLYVYDLVGRKMIDVSVDNPTLQASLKEANSYFGNFTRVDWKTSSGDGIDGNDDAIFVGTVGGSPSSPTGVLKKIKLEPILAELGFTTDGASGGATAFTAANVQKPISAAPITTRDTRNKSDVKEWVSFGTGRYQVAEDSGSGAEQAYYGVLNPTSASDVDLTSEGIVDLTEVVVLPDSINNVENRDGSAVQYTRGVDTTTFTRYKALARFVEDEGGWYRRFETGYTGHGAERNISDATHFGSTLLFTTYMPSTDSCTVGGLGFLYGLNAFTGLPPEPRGSLGTGIVNGSTYALDRVGLGNTVPSSPVVHSSAAGGSKAVVQGSRGEFILTDLFGNAILSGRHSWREVQGIEFLLTD